MRLVLDFCFSRTAWIKACMGAWAHFNIENVGGCRMAWASQRSRRAINYAFIVASNRISGPSCIFPSYTWAPFQSKWGREKTAAASNRAAAVSSMPYAAFHWFYNINQGISGSSTRDTLNSCAVAPSGSSFAMQMIGRMILVILFIMLSPCRAGIAAQLKMSLISFL